MTAWDQIAGLARLAPTPHNTQPFRLRPRDDQSADIIVLADRMLPREDHGNLYVASAFGILAESLRRAARHFGHILDVTPRADIEPATLHHTERTMLGSAAITGACAPESCDELLDARRTSRIPYQDRVVASDVIGAMTTAADARDHRLITHGDDALVRSILALNASAIIDNLQLDDEREEIRRWYRVGDTPRNGDGLWQYPMNQSAWELWSAFAAPRVFRLPGFRQLAVRRYLRTQRGTRHIALLCGAFATWPELIVAGEMLLDLWLIMSRHGVYMQPMGSMLTNPHYAAEIARRFGVSDCWLVFRFGYSDAPPRAPRLDSILINE